MKRFSDPWVNLPHSKWCFSSFNSAADLEKPDTGQQNTPLMVFPTYNKPYGCPLSGNAALPFPEIQARKSSETMSTLNPSAIPTFGPPDFAGPQKRFLVFNQSWDRTSLIFSSSCNPSLTLNPTNQSMELQGSNETVSVGHGGEAMHEDTEEIDALLYSDSDDDYGEEAASTGHSPIEPTSGNSSEVASSVLPVKRKRIDVDELDASLVDTASSANSQHHDSNLDLRNKNTNTDGESICVGGDDQDRKRVKRERILETVGVLRRIIPGGKGKDAATILDEAICYLKSLKLKAKFLGATTLSQLQ